MDISHILNEVGEDRQAYRGALVPPMMQTVNFAFPTVAAFRDAVKDEFDSFVYSRGKNPTVSILREKIAALEGTEDALILASGISAITGAVLSQLRAGDHIVSVANPYRQAGKFFDGFLKDFGVSVTYIDGTDAENFAKACRPETRVFYLESPNSFTFELQDLAAVSAIARQKGVTTIIDNSFSGPLFQRPADFGIDIVVHSASKYLNGHGDVLAGVICANKATIRHIFHSQMMNFGNTITPNAAWLMLRGLRSLHVRQEYSARSAAEIVPFVEKLPGVKKLFWPFSDSHPQQELARRQMKNCGSLFTVALDTNSLAAVERFVDGLQRFRIAVSWGGYESLVLPSCAWLPADNDFPEGTFFNIVRFYIGLEEPEVLKADLKAAFERL